MRIDNLRGGGYRKLFIGTVVLLLIVLSSSIFFATRMKGNERTSPQVQKPATATPTIPDACQTGKLTPVPTEVPRVTPTAEATVEVNPELPTPTPLPTPLFYDDFADNSKGWPEGNSGGYTRAIADHQLILCATNHRTLTETLPRGTPFENFILHTTVTLVAADHNDSVGFFLRGDTNLDHNYRIDIFGDNVITLTKEYLNEKLKPDSIEIARYAGVARLMPTGKPNAITITMNGNMLQLKMNNQVIDNIMDPDYPSGQIALYVNNGQTSDGVMAAFANIEIMPVDEFYTIP